MHDETLGFFVLSNHFFQNFQNKALQRDMLRTVSEPITTNNCPKTQISNIE